MAEKGAIEVDVRGMQCGGCVARLESVLKAADGVDEVEVTLEPGKAVVRGVIDADGVRALVSKAGFEPV